MVYGELGIQLCLPGLEGVECGNLSSDWEVKGILPRVQALKGILLAGFTLPSALAPRAAGCGHEDVLWCVPRATAQPAVTALSHPCHISVPLLALTGCCLAKHDLTPDDHGLRQT